MGSHLSGFLFGFHLKLLLLLLTLHGFVLLVVSFLLCKIVERNLINFLHPQRHLSVNEINLLLLLLPFEKSGKLRLEALECGLQLLPAAPTATEEMPHAPADVALEAELLLPPSGPLLLLCTLLLVGAPPFEGFLSLGIVQAFFGSEFLEVTGQILAPPAFSGGGASAVQLSCMFMGLGRRGGGGDADSRSRGASSWPLDFVYEEQLRKRNVTLSNRQVFCWTLA